MRYFNLIKNTEPLLLHFNSNIKSVVQEEDFFNKVTASKKIIVKPENLTILTYAFGKDINNFPLIKQLQENNIEYINLCDFHTIDKWSMLLKISMLSEYLNNENVKTKYVVILDASDIVLSENFENIVDSFIKTNKKILYGAGQNKYPNVNFFNEIHEISRTPNRYLNAGTVIAETQELKDFINKVMENIDDKKNVWKSEQYVIRKTLSVYEKKDLIDFDSKCIMFQTMDKTKFEIANNSLIIK